MSAWLRNVWMAIYTVAHGLWVTLRYWLITYRSDRGTFTEKFAYPELPVPVTARYRGFHRFDLTTCIACDQCAEGLSGGLHLHWQGAGHQREGIPDHGLCD